MIACLDFPWWLAPAAALVLFVALAALTLALLCAVAWLRRRW